MRAGARYGDLDGRERSLFVSPGPEGGVRVRGAGAGHIKTDLYTKRRNNFSVFRALTFSSLDKSSFSFFKISAP